MSNSDRSPLPSGMAALNAVMAHDAEGELRRVRAELAISQQELRQYRQLLPDLITSPQSDGDWPGPRLRTITLKARSEFPCNVDNAKVASILNNPNFRTYIQSLVINSSRSPLGCAYLVIKFGVSDELELNGMYNAIRAFLTELLTLDDCHRICQTLNFADEYDGDWRNTQDEQVAEILRRLPEKINCETLLHA